MATLSVRDASPAPLAGDNRFGVSSPGISTPRYGTYKSVADYIGVMDFTHNSSDYASSITGREPVVGDLVMSRWFSSSKRDDSGMWWRCVATTGAGQSRGTVFNHATHGLCVAGKPASGAEAIDANNSIWQCSPRTADRMVHLEALGIICDGVTTGQQSKIERAIDGAIKSRIMLYNDTSRYYSFRTTETVDLKLVNCKLSFQIGSEEGADFYQDNGTNHRCTITEATAGVVTFIDGGGNPIEHGFVGGEQVAFNVAGVGRLPKNMTPATIVYVSTTDLTTTTFKVSSSPGGTPINTTRGLSEAANGATYCYKLGATAPKIDTIIKPMWDGTIRRLGVGVKYGADANSIREKVTQHVRARGDGNYDFTIRSTCAALYNTGSDGPFDDIRSEVTYSEVGMVLTGPNEKKWVHVKPIYCYCAVWCPFGSSQDTIHLEVSGTRCNVVYEEYQRIDTSVKLVTSFEGRSDPGDDTPAFIFRNGKGVTLSGIYRAWEGLEQILIDKSDFSGVDTVQFDNFRMIHGYGRCLWARRARYLSGSLHIHDNANGPVMGGSDTRPTVQIDRVISASELHGHLDKIIGTNGVQIGTEDGLYSVDAHCGHWSINMGDAAVFNDDGTEAAAGFPSNSYNALRVMRGKGITVDVTQCRGTVDIGAQVQSSDMSRSRIMLPEHAKRYTITVDEDADVSLGYPLLIDPVTGSANPEEIEGAVMDVASTNIIAGSNITTSYNPTTKELTLNATAGTPSNTETTVTTEYTTTVPSSPVTGLTLFAQKLAGRVRPASVDSNGAVLQYQPPLDRSNAAWVYPIFNQTTPSSVGTFSAYSNNVKVDAALTTNDYTMTPRIKFTNASANTVLGWRAGTFMFARANAAAGKRSGFYVSIVFGVEAADGTNGAIIAGLLSSTGNPSGTQILSGLRDCVFVGKEEGDTNLSIFCANSSTMTSTSLGASFPANTSSSDLYRVELSAAPNGSSIHYRVENLISGAVASGELSTTLPTATTLLSAIMWGSTKSSTAGYTLALGNVYMEGS